MKLDSTPEEWLLQYGYTSREFCGLRIYTRQSYGPVFTFDGTRWGAVLGDSEPVGDTLDEVLTECFERVPQRLLRDFQEQVDHFAALASALERARKSLDLPGESCLDAIVRCREVIKTGRE